MKLYLDDNRATPVGWFRAYGYKDCIERLETKQVQEISLDHDLEEAHYGNDWSDKKTGYDVLLWMLCAIQEDRIPAPIIHIHSWNPVGRERMFGALKASNYPKIGRVGPGAVKHESWPK